MIDLILSNNAGVRVVYRTDLPNLTGDNFTVMEVIGLSDAEEALALGLPKIPTTVAALKAIALAKNLYFTAEPVGDKGVIAATEMYKSTLATPAVPTASAILATSMKIGFTAVPNATGYVLDRATNVGFTTGLVTTTVTGGLSSSQTGLTTATTYYFRVRATGTNYTTSANSAVLTQATS